MKITSSFVLASLTLAATSPSINAAPVFNVNDNIGSPELDFGSPRIAQFNVGTPFRGIGTDRRKFF